MHRDKRIAQIPMGGACAYGQADNARLQNSAFTVSAGVLQWDRECLITPQIPVHVRDVFRWTAPGLIDWQRSWWHEHSDILRQLELSASIEVFGRLHSHLLPGILYDGNAGAIASRLVPRLAPEAENLFEEHKFPTPLVHVESEIDLTLASVTLQATPTPVLDGNIPDQWWSLGIDAPTGRRARLLSASGRVALNGHDQTIYDAQNHASSYPDAWVNARPQQVYAKQYRIHVAAEIAAFQSWRAPLVRCLAAQPPISAHEFGRTTTKALEEALALKTRYALNRWFEDEQACGMLWHPNRPDYAGAEQSVEYGWVGQNMRLGLSLWRCGKRSGNADLMERGTRIADRWIAAALDATRQNKPAPTRYVIKHKRWVDVMGSGEGYSRATFETLYELAQFCRRLRRSGDAREAREQQLFELLDWYVDPLRRRSDGLYPLVWSSNGEVVSGPLVTAGALSIAALAEAAALPGGERFLEPARNLMQSYAAAFLDKGGVHPCGSALDSGCEDMESGMFLLMSARTLYAAESSPPHGDANFRARVLEWAAHAADWVLTWAYTWNVPLLPGTLLGDAGLHTRGFSDVSVQNRHLHVFSPTAEIAHFAPLLDADPGALAGLYREQALRMLVPVIETIARPDQRWGMDEDGEQTEQYNQTNYIQHPNDPVCKPRGGIARWFVPWMTTWVMSICLDFLELPPSGSK
jgi:hypothetical protein